MYSLLLRIRIKIYRQITPCCKLLDKYRRELWNCRRKARPRRPNLYEAELLSEFLFWNKTGKGAFPESRMMLHNGVWDSLMRLFVTLFGYNGVGLATDRPDPSFWCWKDLSGRISRTFDDALARRLGFRVSQKF